MNTYNNNNNQVNNNNNQIIDSMPKAHQYNFNDAYRTIMIINVVLSSIGLAGVSLFFIIYISLINFLPIGKVANEDYKMFKGAVYITLSIIYVVKVALYILNITFSAISLKHKTAKYFVAINVFLWITFSIASIALAIAMLVTKNNPQQRFYSIPPAQNQAATNQDATKNPSSL